MHVLEEGRDNRSGLRSHFFGIFLLEEAEFGTNLALLHRRGACSDAAVLLVPLQAQKAKANQNELRGADGASEKLGNHSKC